jgi:glycosyltransferase involved in cell wall biosynthesis
MSDKTGTFVSVILPVRDVADVMAAYLDGLVGLLAERYEDYEVVVVDDGSADATPEILQQALKRHEGLRVLTLARHYGLETAAAAGFDTVVGDVVVVMLAGDDQVEVLPQMVERVRAGKGFVIGRRPVGDLGLFDRLLRWAFHRACALIAGFEMPERTTGFIGLSRGTLNSINQVQDKYRFVKSYSLLKGYHVEYLEYRQTERGREWRRPMGEALGLAVDILVSNSLRPLRLASGLALLLSGFNLLYMTYIVLIYFLKAHVAEGWVTLSMQNAVAFFGFSVVFAIFGEYLGRVLMEARVRPEALVASESASSVLIPGEAKRINVVEGAEGGAHGRV